ncbi:PEP/pyruvate-binding domain-containing protein [Clostridiaceae bacterium M8S5]|nr:PEP/pyruvate-binding domain-containing protein [Clostridiaceae bacterium M8S5]
MIYDFRSKKTPKLTEVGGKAQSLIEMTKAGLKVPEGIVLSTGFFTPWLTEIKSSDIWKQLLEGPTTGICQLLETKAKSFTLTKEQEIMLENAMKSIEDGYYAVRSSSPEEDLEGTSFAGMYTTILGVTKDRIPESIAKAFSSMFNYRVMEYKNKNHMHLEHSSISIIIQRQIPSEISGIGFSINPSNNCYDEAMVNASFGLGETIVSGVVTPDTYIINKVKQKILEKKIGKKDFGLWLNRKGGTLEKSNEDPMKQALSDKQIIEVSELVQTCEIHYNKPMDIEWAYYKGILYLLQARPITTYIPLFPELVTKPGEEKYLYMDTMGLTQGFTESMSVLGMDVWIRTLDLAKGDIYPTGVNGAIVPIHGRQYIHVSNIAKTMGVKRTMKRLCNYDGPTRMIFESIDFAKEYLPAKKPYSTKHIYIKMLKQVINIGIPIVKTLLTDYKKLRDDYRNASMKAKKGIREGIYDNKLYSEVVEEVMNKFFKITKSYSIILTGMIAMRKLKKLFKGEDMEARVVSLGMDLEGNPTSAMGHHMYRLACYKEIIETKSSQEFIRNIKNRAYSSQLMRDYDSYMHAYGCRGFKEIDIAAPRTYENLEKFYKQLKSIRIEDNHLLHVKKRRREAYTILLERAKEKGIEKKFVKYASLYQNTFGYREDPKYIFVYGVAELRKQALKLGDRFVKEGRLRAIEEVFDLHIQDITIAQRDATYDLIKARDKNLAPYKEVEHIKDWPNIIDSRGKIYRPIRKGENGDIIGDPIAPGIVRGRAKVLHSPYEKALEPGEILVTRATEPAWTPIFVNAAGVVLEVGGPLQHGAIIAREYGIPCVSGISNVQKIIKDGDLLEVDGSSGIVRIIEDTSELREYKVQDVL